MIENLRGRKPTLIDMEKCRRSAVVIPLIEKDKGYEVLFEVRSDKLKRQPGEICFPGGRGKTGNMRGTFDSSGTGGNHCTDEYLVYTF